MDGTGETSATYEVPAVNKVSNTKKTASVYAVSDGQNNTIPIPKDFYYVGGNIKSGIVISDSKDDEKKYATAENGDVGKDLKGNQFVWIPCSLENYHKIDWQEGISCWDKATGKAEKFQIEKYGGFYIGRYEAGVSVLDKSTGAFVDSVTFGTNNLKEKVPSNQNSHGWGWQNKNYQARSNSITLLLGQEYGENKASGNIVVKQDSIPYYHADYYTAVEMSERLYNNKGAVASGLATGTQWDMMIKYMQDNGIVIKGEKCDWGNIDDVVIDEITGYYTNIDNTSTYGFKDGSEFTTDGTTGTRVLLTTGASEKVKRMNLYDVAGNLYEWTDEAAYVYNGSSTTELAIADYNTFTLRGGSCVFWSSSTSVASRTFSWALDSSTNCGFRVALYIK